MSSNLGAGKLVTDGLVLYMDAANKNSYPGSGTLLVDLSPSQTTGSLVNGPTFSSDKNGGIVFDGTNDYADFYAPNLNNIATVQMWAKITTIGNMMMGWNTYDIYTNGGRLGYNTGNGDIYGISSATVTNLGIVNNWKHYTFEMRSDVSYTNNKIYINTVSQTLSQQLSTESAIYRTLNSGYGRISGWRYDTGYNIGMVCTIFSVYNRALTTVEISQNFEATRERFGV